MSVFLLEEYQNKFLKVTLEKSLEESHSCDLLGRFKGFSFMGLQKVTGDCKEGILYVSESLRDFKGLSNGIQGVSGVLRWTKECLGAFQATSRCSETS